MFPPMKRRVHDLKKLRLIEQLPMCEKYQMEKNFKLLALKIRFAW